MNNMTGDDDRLMWEHIIRHHGQATVLSVDELAGSLKAAKRSFERDAIVRIFRTYQDRGLGTFRQGRRGKRSRLVWKTNPAALGALGVKTPPPGVVTDSPVTRLLHYPIPLRKGLSLTMSLPEDLTVAEADRLAQFIRSLPIPSAAT